MKAGTSRRLDLSGLKGWLYLLPAIGFLGLFARVIKNMLAEAIVLKEENDYTI